MYPDYQAVDDTPGVTPGVQARRIDRLAGSRAREAYRRALALVHDDAERRLLEQRLAELGARG